MSVSQQTVGGESCGACASSYVIQEFLNQVLSINEIKALWEKVKFDSLKGNSLIAKIDGLSLYWDHTDPTKLLEKLRSDYNLTVKAYRSSISDLNSPNVDSLLENSNAIIEGDGMGQLGNSNRRAIGIFLANGGLHYILTKYSINKFWIKDSNSKFPEYKEGPLLLANGTKFQGSVDNVPVIYKYLGACLVVYK